MILEYFLCSINKGTIGCLSFKKFNTSIEVDSFLFDGNPNLWNNNSAICLGEAILNSYPARA